MKTLLCLILSLLIYCNIHAADPWSTEDILLETAFQIALAIDWAQTHEIVNDPKRKEINPILGSYPSHRKVDELILLASLSHILMTNYIPQEHRKLWLEFSIAIELVAINHNHRVNIRIVNHRF